MIREFLTDISEWNEESVLSVLGPTGTGKTQAVLEEVRHRFPRNFKEPLLISVDAVAVFQGLDIGSAKPTKVEQEEFSWEGLNLFPPEASVTAADFALAVAPSFSRALKENRPVILVGGSHFYERALVNGMGRGAVSNAHFIESLNKSSNEEIFNRLLKVDPRWGDRVHPNDRYRLERYLDLAERQHLSLEDLSQHVRSVPDWQCTQTYCHGMDVLLAELRSRLQRRIKNMFDEGWVDEVKKLLDGGLSPHCQSLSSIGYREIVSFLGGHLNQENLEEAILVSHQQLGKKQRTWIRGLLKSALISE